MTLFTIKEKNIVSKNYDKIKENEYAVNETLKSSSKAHSRKFYTKNI